MCFAPQWRALFRHLNFQKWSDKGVFCTFWLGNVLRATTACNSSSLIWPAGSAPAALASLLFDPPEPQIIGKRSVSRLSDLFSHLHLLSSYSFSSTLLSSNLSLLSASSLLCFSSVHIVGSLTSNKRIKRGIDDDNILQCTYLYWPVARVAYHDAFPSLPREKFEPQAAQPFHGSFWLQCLIVEATFGGSDVEKVHAIVARSTFRSQNVKNNRGSDHFWRFRCRFASLHYITLHYTPLHYTPLHYTTTLHYAPLH